MTTKDAFVEVALDMLGSVTGGFMQSDDAGGPLNDGRPCPRCSTSPDYDKPGHMRSSDFWPKRWP